MGVSSSAYKLPQHFVDITSWPTAKVISLTKEYKDGEYDFGIDHTVIMTLTGLTLEESKVLLKSFAKNDSGVINSMVFIVGVILLAEPNRRVESYQLSTIFDLFDFDHAGQFPMDVFSIMLMTISIASGHILSRQDDVPTDKEMIELATAMYNKINKNPSSAIAKEEVLLIAMENFTDYEFKTIDTVFDRMTLGPMCLEFKSDEDSTIKSGSRM